MELRFTIRIYKPWPSQNVVNKMHHMARWRLMLDYMSEIEGEVLAHGDMARRWRAAGMPLFTHVALYRMCKGKGITDHGNLVGGAKQLIDAIKNCGLIEDDSDDKVTITYYQGTKRDTAIVEVCKEPMGTTVVLT